MNTYTHAAFRSLACALLSGVLSQLALAQTSPGVYDNRVVIGQTLALTGPFGDLSTELLKGSSAYFEAVNAAGGIHGRRIEVVAKDDGYVADRAATNAMEFVESAFCIFNSFGTPPNEAILPIAERNGIPVIAPYTGALSVRHQALRNVYNIRASYSDEARHLIRHLYTIGIRRVAIVHQNNNFGQEILSGLKTAMTDRKIDPVWSGSIETDASNASAMAKKAVDAKPEVIILGVAGKSTIEAIKTIKSSNSGIQIYALSILATPSNLRALGSIGRGVVISQVVPFPNPTGSSLVREYSTAMSKAGHKELNHISLEGYLNAKILVEALRRSGKNLTRTGFHQALQGLRNFDAGGVNVTFGRGAASASSFVELTMIDRDGRLIK